MSIAQRLVNLSDGLTADGVLSAAKGGTGTTTGAGSSTPTISTINYGGDDTATNPAGGATITLTGTNFASGAKVLINTTPVGVVTVVSATQITFTAPQLAAGSYILYVVNLDGSTAIAVPGIQYSGTPAWTTAAGSLGTSYETGAVSSTVSATSDSAVSYSVISGTLPDGVTINASGTISGTSPIVAGSTTYTFTVRATDLELQDTDRQFSLTINPDVVTWSSANAIAVQQDAASTTTLVATSAAGQTVSYAVDTLPTGLTLSGDTVSGTATVSGTTTTTATATAAVTGKTAQQTITWTVSIAADTYFKYTTLLLNSETSATPFLADASVNNFALTSFGDTKPSNFNPYTPGYYSNYFDGAGDYISVPDNVAFTMGAGDFTIECWVYLQNVAQQIFIGTCDAGGSQGSMSFVLGLDGSSYPLVGVGYGGTVYKSTFGTVATTNRWYHIAGVRNGAMVNVYVDGVKGPNLDMGALAITDSTQTVAIGRNGAGNFEYVTGYISNVRIVKGTAVYTANFTPPTSPLTAISGTSLLTCQSNRFIDNSTNAFAVTKAGEAKVSSFDPFVPNSSYSTLGSVYFDGSGDYLTAPSSSAFTFGTGDFTVEGWAYVTAHNGAGANGIFQQGTTSFPANTTNTVAFGTVSSGQVWQIYAKNTNTSSSATWNFNTWYHFAVVRSSGTTNLYINGVAVITVASDTTNYTGTYFGIGSIYGTGYSQLGYISDVRVVNGTAVYTANFTPPTQPLTAVANTQLLTCQTNQPHTNSQFLDNSSNALNITRTGNTTQGSFSPYGANWSNYFDGSGDYLQYQGSATTTLSGDFTLEAWVNVVNFSSARTILCIGDSYAAPGAMFYIDNAAKLGLAVPSRVYTSSGTVPANTWTHIALVRNSGVITGYINGISQGTASNSSTISGTNSYIGQEIYNGGLGGVVMYGYMSNLRLVKGTALYTANFTPPTAPLTPIAGTSLLTCQSPSLVDNSINAFALTRNGDVSVQKFSPFATVTQTPLTHSVGFDGSGDYLTVPSSSNLVLGSGDFCVEMWYYQQANAFAALFSNAVSSGGGDAQFEIQIASSTFYPTLMGWATAFLTSNVASTPNAWNHIAVCRSGTTLSMFLNGTRVATTTTSNNFSSTNSFHISRQAAGAAAYINGYISNLRVVKGSSVYTPSATTIAVPTQPLTAVANTQLLTCQSSTLIDNSVNQFAITAVGDAKPRRFNPFGWTTSSAQDYTPAVFGSSAYFDGIGDYLQIYNANSLVMSTGAFTAEAWVYPLVSDTWQGGISTIGTSGTGFSFNVSNTNKVRFSIGNSGAGTDLDSTASVIKNTWTHIALVRNSSSTMSLFINGVLQGTATSSANITNTECIIGRGYTNLDVNYLNGYLSDARVISGQALYTSNFVPPTQPLQTVPNTTLLLNMDKSAIQDKSGKVVLETVGDAKVSTAQKKYGTSSLYFDGTGDGLQLPITPQVYLGTTYTIEAWIYSAGGLYYQAIFELCENNTGGFAGLDLIKVGTTIAASVRTTTLGTPVAITGGTLVTNTWQHVALSVNAGSAKLFLDGIQIGSTTTFPEFPIAKTLFAAVGRFANGYTAADTNSWNGYIDDLRITKGYARYTANFTPPAQALLTK